MDRKARLEQMQKICELNFGKVVKGSELLPKNHIKTGNKQLDEALGGGVPQGSIIEIHGLESTGKTALALHIIKAFQKKNKTIVIKDSDGGMSVPYIKRHGVKTKNIYTLNTTTLEDTFSCILQLIPCTDLIVIDSLHAIPSQLELQGSEICMNNPTVKILSHKWVQIKQLCNKYNCTVLVVNQMREKVGILFGDRMIALGGKELKCMTTISLYTTRLRVVKNCGDIVGQDCRITVQKNQLSKPYSEAYVSFMYDIGMI